MSHYRWLLFPVILLIITCSACQPVMPEETTAPAAATSDPEEASTALPDISEEILIPAGLFQMGCDADNPEEKFCGTENLLHTVYLDAYYIDKFEVTNSRYLACVDAGVCTPPRQTRSSTRKDYFGNPDFADYPVLYMDWFKAHDFCAWEGKRLPTEAEWMKAARGADDTRKYPWGDDTPTCDLANAECEWKTSVVGSYPEGASPYGVMDMAGNVGEWVNDWYAADYYSVSPSDNPQGPDTGTSRMNLGGTFSQGSAHYLALSNRNREPANDDYNNHGIRCARSP